jgi:hypothetical protein
MDYKKVYNQIVERAQSELEVRKLHKKEGGYYEGHHITPYSLGGRGRSSNWDHPNIVPLTAREHFIAHYLLSEMYGRGSKEWIKMQYSFNMLSIQNRDQKRYMNNRLYERKRIDVAEANSIFNKGKKRTKSSIEKQKKTHAYNKSQPEYVSPFTGREPWNRGKTYSKKNKDPKESRERAIQTWKKRIENGWESPSKGRKVPAEVIEKGRKTKLKNQQRPDYVSPFKGKGGVKVSMICPQTSKTLQTFSTMKEASIHVNGCLSEISRAANKGGKSAGYYWKKL